MHSYACWARLPRWVATLSALMLLGSAVGCGPDRQAAAVSGTVTLNGEPQEGIFVYFQPTVPEKGDVMDVGSSSYARTDADGRYSLNFMDADKDRPGAVVGTHSVKLDDERTFGSGGGPEDMGGAGSTKSRVPRAWTATFVVPPTGTDEADFELSHK